MKIIKLKAAVAIAADWHDGQWSALYSFASTGYIHPGELPRYLAEIETHLRSKGHKKSQVKRLEQLKMFTNKPSKIVTERGATRFN